MTQYTLDCQARIDGKSTCFVEVPIPPKETIWDKATLGDYANCGLLLLGAIGAIYAFRQWSEFRAQIKVTVNFDMSVVSGYGKRDPKKYLNIKATNRGTKTTNVYGYYGCCYKTKWHKRLDRWPFNKLSVFRPTISFALIGGKGPYTSTGMVPTGSTIQYFEPQHNLKAVRPKEAMYLGVGHSMSDKIALAYIDRSIKISKKMKTDGTHDESDIELSTIVDYDATSE